MSMLSTNSSLTRFKNLQPRFGIFGRNERDRQDRIAEVANRATANSHIPFIGRVIAADDINSLPPKDREEAMEILANNLELHEKRWAGSQPEPTVDRWTNQKINEIYENLE